jgi:hypothetical protein
MSVQLPILKFELWTIIPSHRFEFSLSLSYGTELLSLEFELVGICLTCGQLSQIFVGFAFVALCDFEIPSGTSAAVVTIFFFKI